MRIGSTRDLGLYIRDRRRELRMTQAQAAKAAGVSQRWLSSLESGKPTAEIGLIFKTLNAMRLAMVVEPVGDLPPGAVDLDQLLRALGPQT